MHIFEPEDTTPEKQHRKIILMSCSKIQHYRPCPDIVSYLFTLNDSEPAIWNFNLLIFMKHNNPVKYHTVIQHLVEQFVCFCSVFPLNVDIHYIIYTFIIIILYSILLYIYLYIFQYVGHVCLTRGSGIESQIESQISLLPKIRWNQLQLTSDPNADTHEVL